MIYNIRYKTKRTMSDYSKAVIYGLYCKDITVLEFYIGSTHDAEEREDKHKSACNNEKYEGYNFKVYIFIRENGGWDNWIFKVIQEFPCEIEIQLRMREQYHYDLFKPTLNTNRPYVSEEDRKEEKSKWSSKHYKDNQEEFLKRQAKYHKEHRDEILKRNNQKFTCVCGIEYTHGNKKRHCDSKRHKKFIENQKNNN